VLLHGGGATSTVWFSKVGELSRAHRVHAVDMIGGAGRSVHNGRPTRTLADLMDWLDALFDGLGIDSADLGRHSYGGWLALNYALRAPPAGCAISSPGRPATSPSIRHGST
jgi:pimeloyl-ACP methyl ester carboxylesterase